MQRKVYISNLDSALGYHLAQFYRDDHLTVQPNTLIIGSATNIKEMNGVHAIFNTKIACRAIIECDYIVLNLTTSSNESQIIIKFLKQQSTSIKKNIRIIALSSLLSWSGLQAFKKLKQTEQKFMSKLINQQQWERQIYKDIDYPKRIPDYFSVFVHNRENKLLQLNSCPFVKASILATGLIYGKDNSWFHQQILNTMHNEQIKLYGKGNNIISMIHIEALTKSIIVLMENNIKYAVINQKQMYTQKQIKNIIKKTLKKQNQIVQYPQLYLTQRQSLWVSNIVVQNSPIFDQIAKMYNFRDYCSNHLMSDLCEYTKWLPTQSFVLVQQFSQEQIQQICQNASTFIIIRQQQVDKLNNILVQKAIPPTPQANNNRKGNNKQKSNKQEKVPQIVMYLQALKQLTSQLKNHSFLLVLSNKMTQFISQQIFFNNKKIQIVKQIKQNCTHGQIVKNQQRYYQFLQINKPQIQEQKQIQIINRDQNKRISFNQPKQQTKIDDKMASITQYLLDNVLVYISQAKFQIKMQQKQLNVSNLLNELKIIWKTHDFIESYNNKHKIIQ